MPWEGNPAPPPEVHTGVTASGEEKSLWEMMQEDGVVFSEPEDQAEAREEEARARGEAEVAEAEKQAPEPQPEADSEDTGAEEPTTQPDEAEQQAPDPVEPEAPPAAPTPEPVADPHKLPFDTGRLGDPEYLAQWEKENGRALTVKEVSGRWQTRHQLRVEDAKREAEALKAPWEGIDPQEAREALAIRERLQDPKNPEMEKFWALTDPNHPLHAEAQARWNGRIASEEKTYEDRVGEALEASADEDGVIDRAALAQRMAEVGPAPTPDAPKETRQAVPAEPAQPTASDVQAQLVIHDWLNYCSVKGLDPKTDAPAYGRIIDTLDAQKTAQMNRFQVFEEAHRIRASEIDAANHSALEAERTEGSIPKPGASRATPAAENASSQGKSLLEFGRETGAFPTSGDIPGL